MDGARINDNANVVPLATANLFIKPFANDGYVELPILHFDYHSIRTDALSSNRMQSVRNRLYDVAGQNPYQLNTVFAVAATDAALPTSSPSFVFRPSLFWTNTGRTVATLQADFADGSGFVPLTWNTPRAVSYSTGGAKDVRVRVTYTDGSTWVSHCQVIAPESVAARYAGVSSVTPFTLTADIPYQGAYASALISVEYGGRNKPTPDPAVLDKPLIVVKGFDVSGIFNDENIVPRSTYEGFIIGQLGRQGLLLNDGADLDGYDIVYVDFDNGTDYIQRNARLLEKVIKWVNQNKTGTQPNVILSMSMGGLVAQYALCEIESQNPTNPTAAPGAPAHHPRLAAPGGQRAAERADDRAAPSRPFYFESDSFHQQHQAY